MQVKLIVKGVFRLNELLGRDRRMLEEDLCQMQRNYLHQARYRKLVITHTIICLKFQKVSNLNI